MLSGISRKRSIRSNPYWFTEFCNSQCLSHFAAPFIVVRAETSIAESCKEKHDRAMQEENQRIEIQQEMTAGLRQSQPIEPPANCCPRVSDVRGEAHTEPHIRLVHMNLRECV